MEEGEKSDEEKLIDILSDPSKWYYFVKYIETSLVWIISILLVYKYMILTHKQCKHAIHPFNFFNE